MQQLTGDAGNNPVTTSCGDEQVVIGNPALAAPGIATTPSQGGQLIETTVTDTATLSGGSAPTGTIEFKAYGPSATADCSGTPIDDEPVPVTGNGGATTPTGFRPAQAGTYWWTASYSGDSGNNPAVSGCGAESVVITRVNTSIDPQPGPGGTVGRTLTDKVTVSGFSSTGLISFRLLGPSTVPCGGMEVDSETVTLGSDGTAITPTGFTPVPDGHVLVDRRLQRGRRQ